MPRLLDGRRMLPEAHGSHPHSSPVPVPRVPAALSRCLSSHPRLSVKMQTLRLCVPDVSLCSDVTIFGQFCATLTRGLPTHRLPSLHLMRTCQVVCRARGLLSCPCHPLPRTGHGVYIQGDPAGSSLRSRWLWLLTGIFVSAGTQTSVTLPLHGRGPRPVCHTLRSHHSGISCHSVSLTLLLLLRLIFPPPFLTGTRAGSGEHEERNVTSSFTCPPAHL